MSDHLTRLLAALFGGQFGALMAWFIIEWPVPPEQLGLRLLGWSFFVSWGIVLGVAFREASR